MFKVQGHHIATSMAIRSLGMGPVSSLRFQSTSAPKPFDKNPIYLISIPITTSKSFIYCKHNALSKVSTSPTLETRATGLASKGWNKLESSKNSINKRIVAFVKRLLATIPYDEACLKSFPSKDSIVREINADSIKKSDLISANIPSLKDYRIAQKEIIQNQMDHNIFKPLPLYHPSFQSESSILSQLSNFVEEGQANHKKYGLLCAIGIPISLPFALLPAVPNVPGFYLAYRLYCHYRALVGIKHLKYLLEDTTPNTLATNHLVFKDVVKLDEIYAESGLSSKLEAFKQADVKTAGSTILLTNEVIDRICQEMNLKEISEDLRIALLQETRKLKEREQ